MALKRKKAYENEIMKIGGSRMTIETQVMAIENANVNLETMNAMRAGAEAMKQIHGNLWVAGRGTRPKRRRAGRVLTIFVPSFPSSTFSFLPKPRSARFAPLASDINKVDQVMDDIREQMDLANEISDAISQPVGFGVEFDEEELNQELEELEQESLDEKLLGAEKESGVGVGVGALPSVPSTVPGRFSNQLSVFSLLFFQTRLPYRSFLAIAQPPRPVKVAAKEDDEDAELAELRASMAM